jgi:hypothetical protein
MLAVDGKNFTRSREGAKSTVCHVAAPARSAMPNLIAPSARSRPVERSRLSFASSRLRVKQTAVTLPPELFE